MKLLSKADLRLAALNSDVAIQRIAMREVRKSAVRAIINDTKRGIKDHAVRAPRISKTGGDFRRLPPAIIAAIVPAGEQRLIKR